jgi:ribonuclease R
LTLPRPAGRRPRRREELTADTLRAYLAANPDADRRQAARDLRLKPAERKHLKILFAEIAAAPAAQPARGAPAPPAAPMARDDGADIVVARVRGFDGDTAEALLEPVEWLRPGPPPRIRVRRIQSMALAPGDRALVAIDSRAAGGWRGRILRTAPDLPQRIVGAVRRTAHGRIVEPADRRIREEFLLASGPEPPPEDGELVVVRPVAARRFERPRAVVIERLGSAASPRAASAIALALHDVPVDFSPDALAEGAACPVAAHDGTRADLRDLRLVTIDGADARDFDDAVHAEPDAQTGGFRLTVAIADVAWYVRPGGALDRDAERRGNSVYFPDRVVPMLPERLSNDLCSLRPGQDRPVLAAELRIDAAGALRGHRFLRATMRSAARLTYEQVQDWRDGDAGAVPEALHGPLGHLYAAYAALAAARTARGTLDLDAEEKRVALDGEGRVAAIGSRPRLDAHRLIEEMMILANVAAADALERRTRPCLYRVHEQPSEERIDALRESLATMGYRLARGQAMRPALLRDVLDWARGKPVQAMVNELVLRSQALAVYSPENPGHFGLALPRYAHFTSPIRRYADLVVHRALIEAFELGQGGRRHAFPDLIETGERVSRAERRAQAAERAALERCIADFLATRTGAWFDARVTGLHRAGIFVTLTDTGANGLVPLSSLPGYWRLHPAGHRLDGPVPVALGDRVEVRLVEAAPLSGALRFELGLPDAPAAGRGGRGGQFGPAGRNGRTGRKGRAAQRRR